MRGVVGVAALALSASAGMVSAAAQDGVVEDAAAGPIVPVDEQQWTDQAEMTWDDYTPIRPEEWNSDTTSQGSESQYRTAVILLDYEDQAFLITQDPESHPFGNPLAPWKPVAPEDVNQWYYDYYAVPNEYNQGQTLHGYWMETSHGRIGVTVEVFGPYTLPGKLHEYGAQSHAPATGPNSICPAGDSCNKNVRTDGSALWHADIGCETGGLCGFDNGFYVTAGHDETSTWQEFGEMMFRTPADVPAEFGPPGATEGPVLNAAGNPIPNAVPTRYVPWTSWQSAANHWPNAGGGTSTQAENSGLSVFAHEFSHLRGLPDNYNNPFNPAEGRNRTGYWEMMSRGSFNGPGGTHNRWQVPNAGGSALGPHHTLHFKTVGNARLGVVQEGEYVDITRAALAEQGVAVTPLKARSSVPDGDMVGLNVELDSPFETGTCEARVDDPFFCTPAANWTKFTMEVVDRVGNDSFVAGHGVLLAQARNTSSPRVWLVDANPEDIDRIDFYRPGNDTEPGGEPVPVVKGDPRQLDDATFHAGTASDSEYEYLDAPNKLHFYVLDTYRDADGVLFYDVAVRNTDAAGPYTRDVSLGDAATYAVGDSTALVNVPLTNSGEAGTGLFASDVYRITSTVSGSGWEVSLPYEVRAAAAGATVPVWAYATAGEDASESATLTITATSETDPTATVTIEVELGEAAVDASFEATDALLASYRADGFLGQGEYQRMKAQLDIAARSSGRQAERALDRFSELASDLADTGARDLVSAALVSVTEDLRD
ncbi:M6 family metalloprotease domain-containing protein [Jiangella gansuensis]|uniref:M6 family metalloprotease domain-containing protein n=1 Tax=Jiangella gansuensis TaxID=281473 RepID=UPI0006888276|nr:M6 family metalloprotease domain-containing protein [Jiangella gansuensis]